MPGKLIAISDIEGNFGGLYSFLLANKVIDKRCNWIFGKGHLVLNGDFVDRGKQVTQVLWLIYKLDQQALESGGKVHYILGNHEIMMLQGNVSYANFKNIEAAKQISMLARWDDAMRFVYSKHSALGKWLRTKNIIERVGEIIFVHAGLNIDYVRNQISVGELNKIARQHYGIASAEHYDDPNEQLVLSSITGPYWDRSLAMDFKHRALYWFNGVDVNETTNASLDSILHYYEASRIVVGHSVVSDIQKDYSGKVIKIDVKHSEGMRTGFTKGILLQRDTVIKLDDKGQRMAL